LAIAFVYFLFRFVIGVVELVMGNYYSPLRAKL